MSHSTQPRLQALATLTALMVAACGGGGGSSEPVVDTARPPTTTTPPVPPPPEPPPPPTALELSTAFLAAFDQTATTPPATGAAATAMQDGCFLDNGTSSKFLANSYDATGPDALASVYGREQRKNGFGAKRNNIQVLDDRRSINADGSARREIDVKYDVVYLDGTTFVGGTTTLIAGNSSGTCATQDNKAELRFFGNRKLASLQVIARNSETAQLKLSDGTPQTTSVFYRREVRFQFRDPGNVATYMIVTGPGLKPASGKPFSLKMLSPRLLRDAPELAGRNGSANFIDTDGFSLCSAPNAANELPDATIADCVGFGAAGDSIGATLNGPVDATKTANADAFFDRSGWVAGGVYTISVYDDDGWKTVGGQDGKTPIAVYTETLDELPYSFAAMQKEPAQYPRIVNSSLSMAQLAEAARTGGGTVQLTWQHAQPPAGGQPVALLSATTFADGVKRGSTTGFPRVRDFAFYSPGLNQVTANVSFTGKNPATDNKRYQNFSFYYGDRGGHAIQYTLQLY